MAKCSVSILLLFLLDVSCDLTQVKQNNLEEKDRKKEKNKRRKKGIRFYPRCDLLFFTDSTKWCKWLNCFLDPVNGQMCIYFAM